MLVTLSLGCLRLVGPVAPTEPGIKTSTKGDSKGQ